MANTIRAGIVGCGFAGRIHHFQALDTMNRLKLVDADISAAYDINPERMKVFKTLKPGVKTYDNASSLINSNEVDVVFVCTPTKFHKQIVAETASAGKDVFCEKPMATNLKDAEEMLKMVEQAGTKAQVGLVLRYEPFLNYLKYLIDANERRIEPAMFFLLRDDQYFPIRGQYMSSWRKERDLAGGGALIEHSIHDVDFMRWFFGDIEEVRATTRYFSGREVEDLASVWLRFENGAEGTLTSIWHELSMRMTERLIEIFYNKGLFHLEIGDVVKSTTQEFYQIGEEPPVKITYKEADEYTRAKIGIQSKYALGEMVYEDYSFIRSIQNGKQPFPGFDVGVQAHKIVDAAYRSSKDSSAIRLKDI